MQRRVCQGFIQINFKFLVVFVSTVYSCRTSHTMQCWVTSGRISNSAIFLSNHHRITYSPIIFIAMGLLVIYLQITFSFQNNESKQLILWVKSIFVWMILQFFCVKVAITSLLQLKKCSHTQLLF